MAHVDHTEDGRYIVVDGRRWPSTDPGIPDQLKSELVSELMSARRAVGKALRDADAQAEARARVRVGDAKLALGERGRPWWEVPTEESIRARSRAILRTLLRHRGRSGSVATSEVSDVLGSAASDELFAELCEAGAIEAMTTGKEGPAQYRMGPELPL